MVQTAQQYTKEISTCREIFAKKTKDYGTAWRILRPSSLTDQIFIKAQRIRTLQETGISKVGEGIEDEFRAIVNYCIMALIQLCENDKTTLELPTNEATKRTNKRTNKGNNKRTNKQINKRTNKQTNKRTNKQTIK